MRTKFILLSSLVIYLVLYLIYYPQIYAIFDEACYIDLAYALRKGTVYLEQAGLGTLHYPVRGGVNFKVGSHFVSLYPIGNAVFLMPFTFLGARGMFLYGFVFHLLGYIIFIKVLKSAGVDTKYAVLYLFYPPQLLFSRTVLSDVPAAVFVLLAFYFYQREKYPISGVMLGLSFVIRYAGIALVPAFLVFALIRKRWKGLKLVAGFLPFLLFILFYNYIVHGGMIKTGYPMVGVVPFFDIHRYGIYLLIYILSLSIFYPLMIIAPFLYKRAYRFEILTSCLVMLIFYIFSSFAFVVYDEPSIKSIIKTSLLAVRYFFPIIPLILIAYSDILAKYLNKLKFLAVWGILIIISIGVSQYHHRYLNSQAKFRDSLYSHTNECSLIICNGEVTELVSPMWGRRNLILFEEFVAKYHDKPLEDHDVWIATLIRQDRPIQGPTVIDSIMTGFDTQLVERLTRIDKEFKLFKIILDKFQ